MALSGNVNESSAAARAPALAKSQASVRVESKMLCDS